jgi:hypothetical protein
VSGNSTHSVSNGTSGFRAGNRCATWLGRSRIADESTCDQSINFMSMFTEPPHGQVPGWVTEPLLRMRVACYVAPMTADEASPLKASVRTKIADALNALELSTSLRALAHQLTPLTAPRRADGSTARRPRCLAAQHGCTHHCGPRHASNWWRWRLGHGCELLCQPAGIYPWGVGHHLD